MNTELLKCKLLIRKYEKVLKLFSNDYNEQKNFVSKNKYIVKMRLAGFTRSQSVALGFNVKKYSWEKCFKKRSKSKLTT